MLLGWTPMVGSYASRSRATLARVLGPLENVMRIATRKMDGRCCMGHKRGFGEFAVTLSILFRDNTEGFPKQGDAISRPG